MILRLSQKLSTKIKAGTLKAMPQDENPYADWSCHLFTAFRTQYILVSNTNSLYSSVLYGKGIVSSLREFMADDGQAFIYQKFVAPSSATVSFATALNRPVTGSMNELIGQATDWLEAGDVSPHDIGFGLNETPLSAIAASKSDKYGKPNNAFKRLADAYVLSRTEC